VGAGEDRATILAIKLLLTVTVHAVIIVAVVVITVGTTGAVVVDGVHMDLGAIHRLPGRLVGVLQELRMLHHLYN